MDKRNQPHSKIHKQRLSDSQPHRHSRPDRKIVFNLYKVDRLSGRQIADKFKVTQSVVRRWLRYYGIEARNYHENPCPTRGKHLSETHRKKISIKLEKNKNGGKKETHWNWQGGITPINAEIRNSKRYAKWRMKVFRKDGFKCINCGSKKEIEADHIKPFCKFEKLRFRVKNGRTFCQKCHKKIGWQLFKDDNPNK
jgi:transposase